jgi:hypothetical protein
LIPANQISTDTNQTNLALKGIIDIQAMSVIAGIIGNTADAQSFQTFPTTISISGSNTVLLQMIHRGTLR